MNGTVLFLCPGQPGGPCPGQWIRGQEQNKTRETKGTSLPTRCCLEITIPELTPISKEKDESDSHLSTERPGSRSSGGGVGGEAGGDRGADRQGQGHPADPLNPEPGGSVHPEPAGAVQMRAGTAEGS